MNIETVRFFQIVLPNELCSYNRHFFERLSFFIQAFSEHEVLTYDKEMQEWSGDLVDVIFEKCLLSSEKQLKEFPNIGKKERIRAIAKQTSRYNFFTVYDTSWLQYMHENTNF